jgi:NAD(P)-dependent dehydrogenase (short-subunit alcohol dehydrogenase family)
MKIENSVILITGGASGIGESIAMHLFRLGGVIYICDMNESKGNLVQSNSNEKIRFIKCDITNEDDVKAMIATIKEEQGRLDAVVNSAGIVHAELTATEKSIHNSDSFNKVFRVNTYGSFLVSKHSAALMIEKHDKDAECNGTIVFIASVAGLEGQRGQLAYSSSKGALVGMTLPMARDLGKWKIRVATIAPGLIETPMTAGFKDNKVGKMLIESTPIKSLGKPIHIALAAEFIIKNDFVNGTVIRVDGGIRFPHF